jgi:UDP-N-acetylmuramoyl-tripeptide--D-alanyl-D-alanine ligase
LPGPAIRGVDIDSRALSEGDLFVALAGERDGHDFIPAAVAAGAAAVLVSRAGDWGVPALQVEDTLDGLRAIAAAARARLRGQLVAITGSSGKTTVKTLLGQALGAHASAASFNNHLGVPLTLARMPADSRHAVVEIGTNHSGEIAPLSRLAQPHVAVLLNVLPAHIGNFDGIEALRAEKLSIADGLVEGGTFVLPEALRAAYHGPARVLTFGTEADADFRLTLQTEDDALRATVSHGDARWGLVVPGGGEHRALSCTAAIAVAVALGDSVADVFPGQDDVIAAVVRNLAAGELPVGRGNRTRAAGIEVIDDSYNANPVSMAHALHELARAPGRRQALLGDILELGDQEEEMHAGLAEHCAGIDRVHCVGPLMRTLHERLPAAQRGDYIARPEDCDAARVAAWLAPGDTLLVKGSNLVFWKRGLVAKLLAALAAR